MRTDPPENQRVQSNNQNVGNDPQQSGQAQPLIPSITLPKGGGAIQGMGEKFSMNPVTGSGSMSVPIATSPGRSGFGPQLGVGYDSGAGNSPFGLGWNLSIPAISRKTAKGLPKYRDEEESDTFLLSGAEDLVPTLIQEGSEWKKDEFRIDQYFIRRYRPRTEGSFARIEKWQDTVTGDVHWKSISPDNIASIYGRNSASRITDPKYSTHIFSWLLEESYDDKGNVIQYEYKQENTENIDPSLPQEGKRLQSHKSFANQYIKRIKYGNRNPFEKDNWLFETIFDYGEHKGESASSIPTYIEQKPWPVRKDPFSSYRSGFEIRTYRLCKRVLMFHHFDELGPEPYLVSSTNFTYEEDPHLSKLIAATQTGYLKGENGAYTSKSLPPVEFGYTEPQIDEQIYQIDPESLENLPNGLDGGIYQWVDLDGEGLSGVLTQQGDAWFYKRNLGSGRFAPLEKLELLPSLVNAQTGQAQIMDIDGDGRAEVVLLEKPISGFFEKTIEIEDPDIDWKNFTPFQAQPNVDWNDPNLRLIDLNGDGFADILLSEDQVFTWYPSLGKKGFGPSEFVPKTWDEEKGPALVFADSTSSIFLADMSGDGLTDIVRIRNHEICYWPNLGYAHFGEKILMDHSPLFDFPELFDPRRIRLSDIDGSGTIDIIYLGKECIKIFYNQAGNSWSVAQELLDFPPIDNLSYVTVIDLLGNGTASLVWSSPLPKVADRPMRYIDIMGGQKPYLLNYTTNNMGAETHMEYAASTKFYLKDKEDGKPWITKLPFPVHVLERMETKDEISGNAFVARYAYHHGYFDGEEREFRGFGMVEQWDTEDFAGLYQEKEFSPPGNNWSETTDIPPVYTKSWFHTGAYRIHDKISQNYKNEYYQGDPDAVFLEDTLLPEGLTIQEEREACRVLRGTILRSEVYALDNTSKSEHPYSVVESKSHIKLIQPQGENQHAVFYVCNCESLTYHYERNPADPRIAHSHTLEIDSTYGMPLKTAVIAYPRRGTVSPDLIEQKKLHIVYSETEITHIDQNVDYYRISLPLENRSYEITGLTPEGSIFQKTKLKELINGAEKIEYEVNPSSGVQMRLLERSRLQYYKNDLSGPLPFGEVESLALPYDSFTLAFSSAHINKIFEGRATITDSLLKEEGKYMNLDNDTYWWIPSGIVIFDPTKFYLPIQSIDPFGESNFVTYDRYSLLTEEVRDPLDNTITSQNDYRLLQPHLLTDPNGNRSEVLFDELGMVIATTVMGKVGKNEGDSLAGYTQKDYPNQDLRQDIYNDRMAYLQSATSFFYYDLHAWLRDSQPSYALSLDRETHGDSNTKTQISFSYSDGFGRTIMAKVQAEPGDAFRLENGNLINDYAPIRWVGNGRTVYNNKGNPVKQYEPYFTHNFEYEEEAELVENGVTPVLHYDPLGRNIRTDLPNGTFSKVEFDPWQQTSFDPNDTVFDPNDSTLNSQWYIERDSPNPAGPEPSDPETRAAWLAAQHANTPSQVYLDSLGRPFIGIDHNIKNGVDEFIHTRTMQDIESNPLRIIDARGNTVMEYGKSDGPDQFIRAYDIAGRLLYQNSMDAGERWMLPNVAGNLIHGYDSRGHHTSTVYDALQRPLEQWVEFEAPKNRLLVQKTIYGESQPNPDVKNLRRQVYQVFDGAGIVTSEEIDFKGNLLRSNRQLAQEYKQTLDWKNAPALEDQVFTTSTEYDALNRPIRSVSPDGSIYISEYNKANLLNAVSVHLRDAATATQFVNNIDYNAKGQRLSIQYDNGAHTTYKYDPVTFRLTELTTTRNIGSAKLQDLYYTYDPVGNITEILDDAQQNVFFNNQLISPHSQYEYDALYQLTSASGREHGGQQSRVQRDHQVVPPLVSIPHPNNPQALQRYIEKYDYDRVGNILSMKHQVDGAGWNRFYDYDNDNNRLITTGDIEGGPYIIQFSYDAHGNMTQLPHLSEMTWDYSDQLQAVNLGGGGMAYYVYDASGKRVRKVIERNENRTNQRIYIGGFEIYQEKIGGSIRLERESLHIMDDQHRIAIVDSLTIESDQDVHNIRSTIRYPLNNHLGSATLELDENAVIISYEEYHPYGTSALCLFKSEIEVSMKRYRYTGLERDDESGLSYHSARYYSSWLGRWLSVDPGGIIDGLNVFQYVNNNPINFFDSTGYESFWYETFIGGAQKHWAEKKHEELESTYQLILSHTLKTHKLRSIAIGAYMISLSKGLPDVFSGELKRQYDKFKKYDNAFNKALISLERITQIQSTYSNLAIGHYKRKARWAKKWAVRASGTSKLLQAPLAMLACKGAWQACAVGGTMATSQGSTGLTELLTNEPQKNPILAPITEGASELFQKTGLSKESSDTITSVLLFAAELKVGTVGGSRVRGLDSSKAGPAGKVPKSEFDKLDLTEFEFKSGRSVRTKHATDKWESFLGKDPTDINPWIDMKDLNRLFSKDGHRAIRFTGHEMGHTNPPAKIHFHYEFYGISSESGSLQRLNVYQGLQNQ